MSLFCPKERKFLSSLAQRIIPDLASRDKREWGEELQIIEETLTRKGQTMIRSFRLFLGFIRLLLTLRPRRETQILEWLQNNPIPILRKGFWGLKTLIYMGYYGQTKIGSQIHYQPSFHGNERLSKRI